MDCQITQDYLCGSQEYSHFVPISLPHMCISVCVWQHISDRMLLLYVFVSELLAYCVTNQQDAWLRWQSGGIREVRPGLQIICFTTAGTDAHWPAFHRTACCILRYTSIQSAHRHVFFHFHRHWYLIFKLWVSYWAAALQLVGFSVLHTLIRMSNHVLKFARKYTETCEANPI